MSTYITCTVCGASPNVCEDTDGGCCSGCRATGGCSHGPVATPTPQARPPAQDVERVLAEVHRAHLVRQEGGHFECSCGKWSGWGRVGHSAHVAAEQAAALRALPTGGEAAASPLSAEQRAEVMQTIGETLTVAHSLAERGRSSMPMHIVDALLLAGLASSHPYLTTPPAQTPSKETDR